MPSLASLEQRYRGKPFKVLLVNVQEQTATVRKFFAGRQVDLEVVLDRDGTVSRDYHVSSHPVKFLIDGQGNLIAMGLGYRDWNSAEIDRLVDILIKNAAEAPRA